MARKKGSKDKQPRGRKPTPHSEETKKSIRQAAIDREHKKILEELECLQ